MGSVYILLFALQLLFSRFVSFRVSFITIAVIAVFFRPPTPACIYSLLLQVYIE